MIHDFSWRLAGQLVTHSSISMTPGSEAQRAETEETDEDLECSDETWWFVWRTNTYLEWNFTILHGLTWDLWRFPIFSDIFPLFCPYFPHLSRFRFPLQMPEGHGSESLRPRRSPVRLPGAVQWKSNPRVVRVARFQISDFRSLYYTDRFSRSM